MKRYVLVVVAVLALLVSGCSDRCAKRETVEFLDQFDDIVNRWADTNDLASSTARIGLAPVIQQMQGLKNEVDNLEDICPAATEFKEQMVESMDLTIEAYLMFMGDESEADVAAKFNEAGTALEIAVNMWAQLKESIGEEVVSE